MTYIISDDVYRTTGLSVTECSTANVNSFISEAEVIACRVTKNIYWQTLIDTTVTSAVSAQIVSSGASWTMNLYANNYVWVYSGTGTGQARKILSNSSTALILDRNLTTIPVNGDLFKIFYVPLDFNPYKSETYNGNAQKYFYLRYYPIKILESLNIQGVNVTPSYVYTYEFTGRLETKTTAEASRFSAAVPQDISVSYWYGVDYLPYEVKRLIEVEAGIRALNFFIGSSFNNPESVTLPEFSITTPPSYQVASKALELLYNESERLKASVKIWPIFG